MAEVSLSEQAFSLTSFRPYEEYAALPRLRVSRPMEGNVISKKVVLKPPPLRTQSSFYTSGKQQVVLRNPSPKQQLRVQSFQPQSSATSSLSGVSAVGLTTGSLSQSHRSIVEEQIDKIISSKVRYCSETIFSSYT